MATAKQLLGLLVAINLCAQAFCAPALIDRRQQWSLPSRTAAIGSLGRRDTSLSTATAQAGSPELIRRSPFDGNAIVAASKQSKPVIEAAHGPWNRAWLKTAKFFHDITPNWLRNIFKAKPPRQPRPPRPGKQPLPGWPLPVPPPNSGAHSPVHGSINPFALPSPIHEPKYKPKPQPFKGMRKSASKAYKSASKAASRAGDYVKRPFTKKPSPQRVNPWAEHHAGSYWPDLPPLGKSKYTDRIGAGSLRPPDVRSTLPAKTMEPIPEEVPGSDSFRAS